MEDEHKLEQKVRYFRIAWIIVGISVVAFGLIGGYVSDRTAIKHNSQLIQQNKNKIKEVQIANKEQNTVLQKILIQVTRVETLITKK